MLRWFPALALLATFGCPPPAALPALFSETPVVEAQHGHDVGAKVRWGGDIAAVNTNGKRTCFEVIDRPLRPDQQPVSSGPTDGRFIACTDGFYDPTLYEHGSRITIEGTVVPPIQARAGAAHSPYARVAVARLYLWPGPAPGRADVEPDFFWWPMTYGSAGYWW